MTSEKYVMEKEVILLSVTVRSLSFFTMLPDINHFEAFVGLISSVPSDFIPSCLKFLVLLHDFGYSLNLILSSYHSGEGQGH